MLIKIFRRLLPRPYCPVWVGTLTVVISVGLPAGILPINGLSNLSNEFWRSPLSLASPSLAQTPPPELALPNSLESDLDPVNSVEQTEEYDRLMQSGYAATQFREYDQALENFRAALALRPQDIYAQQAIFNVETYKALQNRATVPFWLLGGLIGLGIVLVILMLRRGVIQSQQQFLTEVNQRQHESQGLQNRLRDQIFGAESPKSNVTFNPRSPLVAAEEFSPASQSSETINVNGQSVDWMAQLLADLKSPDPDRRRQAIWELARRGDSRAVPELSNLMTISDSQERDLILGALSQISGRTLRPISQALAMSLRDQNPQVRRNAVRDLTRLHELMSQMNQLLTNATQDQDAAVKQTATRALHQYPPINENPAPSQPRPETLES